MVAYARKPYVTPQEYLKWERKAETRSEYHDGVIVGMAGASKEHNRITVNLGGEIHAQLKGKTCEPFASDMRVYVPVVNRYYYPDVVVVCGEPRFEDSNLDTLLNPTLIVEVLSDSTERTDRVEKYDGFTTLESLSTYVLVAQDRPRIECYNRQPDGTWQHTVAKGLEAVLELKAIDCAVPLADVYARVEFKPQPEITTDGGSERETGSK
jgi:Uma2 family endonuclease